MTSKERAKLRSDAHELKPLFQVGQGGINEELIKSAGDARRANELIKLKVLRDTSPISAQDAAIEIAEKTGSEVIAVIGGTMIFYKYNPELHKKVKK